MPGAQRRRCAMHIEDEVVPRKRRGKKGAAKDPMAARLGAVSVTSGSSAAPTTEMSDIKGKPIATGIVFEMIACAGPVQPTNTSRTASKIVGDWEDLTKDNGAPADSGDATQLTPMAIDAPTLLVDLSTAEPSVVLATLSLEHLGGESTAPALCGPGGRLRLALCRGGAADGSAGVGMLLAEDASGHCVPCGAFAVPPRAVDALAALQRDGRITLQLQPPGEGPPGTSGRTAANGELGHAAPGGSADAPAASAVARLDVALTAHALSEEPEDPADVRQRQWNVHLLALLAWLSPQHTAAAFCPARQSQERRSLDVLRGGRGGPLSALQPAPPRSPRSPRIPRSPRSPMSPAGEGGFDAAEIYAAARPSASAPELQGDLPALQPTLRPYQRRAAAWMVARERGELGQPAEDVVHPLWRQLRDAAGRIAYLNPFTGRVAARRFEAPAPVRGGILADEMGLGKTVEVLACLLAHRFPGPRTPSALEPSGPSADVRKAADGIKGEEEPKAEGEALQRSPEGPAAGTRKRPRARTVAEEGDSDASDGKDSVSQRGRGSSAAVISSSGDEEEGVRSSPPSSDEDDEEEGRVDCVCGVTNADPRVRDYVGLWVQCDACGAWLHGTCIGFPRRAPPGEYECGRCAAERTGARVTADCGATLIVCPASILRQWHDEIRRHTHAGALRVVVYEGQEAPAGGRSGGRRAAVAAADLAAADVVLTTYDALRRDVHRGADGGEARALRRRKRYQALPTPLTRLRWWRVCLDEAQMVESSTAKAAEMAARLDAVHRWAVTGTPLSRGLEDLFGLFFFLRAAPLDQRAWWLRVCQRPFEDGCPAGRARLMAALRPGGGGLMWRTAKADVAAELGLPPQHARLARLALSAIERHFYTRQHQACAASARAMLPARLLAAAAAGGPTGAPPAPESAQRRLTPREEKQLLLPLLRLRQACCHPQVGAGGLKALAAAKAPMTMDEILEVLTGRARVEAEDAQRVLLAALNGLAGLMLLEGDPKLAVATYRQALAEGEANKALVRVDPLQRLHTLTNLAELLGPDGGGKLGVPRTLRDSELLSEAARIREEYMVQWVAKLAAAERDYRETLAAVRRTPAGPSEDPASKPSSAPIGRGFRAAAGARRGAAAAAGSGIGLRNQGATDAAVAAAVAALEADDTDAWYLDALDLVMAHSADRGDRSAEAIRDHLRLRDQYNRKANQNASSLARRFAGAAGLKLLLFEELDALAAARVAALSGLEALAIEVASAPDALVEQAATCGRCRAELGEAGRVCAHCRLDERWLAWELRLFSLQSRALAAGAAVSAEDALRQAQAQTLRRVGRGGLHEEGGEGGGAVADPTVFGVGGREEVRREVGGVDLVHHPSEAEQILRLLPAQLRALRSLPPAAAARRDSVLAASKPALERLETERRLFVRGRSLALAQRFLLYAHDELAMAALRMRVRAPCEAVKPHEAHFKLHAEEVPVKNKELTTERIMAEADLKKQLGTLRYLQGLNAARQRVAAAEKGGEGAGEVVVELCPVCQEALGAELAMLPCGHQLCVRCQMALIDRLSSNLPRSQRRVLCPTCRTRTLVADIAYVDAGCTPVDGSAGSSSGAAANADAVAAEEAEERIVVRGSYGIKVSQALTRL
ncbi:hypothetical protein WJX81_006007 [Elliptochloris bilobata]|uniref:RING-type domain-containing protein n=1 Tax=Elliptochloris bilobata TaxID=381761 RepID=A0AAW1SD29_9CHLO